METITLPIICDRSVFSPLYSDSPSSAQLESINECWDVFKDELPNTTISLHLTGEVWSKVEPQLGGAKDWVEGMFNIDKTTLESGTKFKEEASIEELAMSLLELPKTANVVILSNTDKVSVRKKGMVVITTQQFIRKINAVRSLQLADNRELYAKVFELSVCNPNFLDELNNAIKDAKREA